MDNVEQWRQPCGGREKAFLSSCRLVRVADGSCSCVRSTYHGDQTRPRGAACHAGEWTEGLSSDRLSLTIRLTKARKESSSTRSPESRQRIARSPYENLRGESLRSPQEKKTYFAFQTLAIPDEQHGTDSPHGHDSPTAVRAGDQVRVVAIGAPRST